MRLPLFIACLGVSLLTACADEEATRSRREGPAEQDQAAPADDTGDHDVADDTGLNEGGDGDGGSDGGDGGGSDDGGSTGDPGPATDEVCYPGPDFDWTACVPVHDYDSAWGADYAYPDPYDGDPQYLAPARYVDLQTADPDMEVAPNFVLSELMQEWKGRYGVFQRHVVSYLQDIRDASGGPLTINSGYRNVTYNAGVGGATYSRHMYGDSADMASSVASLDEVAEICEDLAAGYIGMYDTHVHCDWRDDPLDGSFFDGAKGVAAVSRPVHTAEIRWGGAGLEAPATGFDEGEPHRRWTARDGMGRELETIVSRTYVPPAEAVSVQVVVGGAHGARASRTLWD